MNKREYAKLKKWTDTLTDDIADIREREKYERWLSRRSDMLEMICSERGIKLWEEYSQEENK